MTITGDQGQCIALLLQCDNHFSYINTQITYSNNTLWTTNNYCTTNKCGYMNMFFYLLVQYPNLPCTTQSAQQTRFLRLYRCCLVKFKDKVPLLFPSLAYCSTVYSSLQTRIDPKKSNHSICCNSWRVCVCVSNLIRT